MCDRVVDERTHNPPVTRLVVGGAVMDREDVDKRFRPGFPGFEVVRA